MSQSNSIGKEDEDKESQRGGDTAQDDVEGKRERVQTEAGKLYQIERLQKHMGDFRKNFDYWRAEAKEIRSNLKEFRSTDSLNEMKSMLQKRWQKLQGCYKAICSITTPSEQVVAQMDTCGRLTQEILELITSREVKGNTNPEYFKTETRITLCKEDDSSVFGDSITETNKTSSSLMDAKAALAEQKVKMEEMEKIHTQKTKLMQLEAELEEAHAETKKKEAFMRGQLESQRIKLQEMETREEFLRAKARLLVYEESDAASLRKSPLNPDATIFVPQIEVLSNLDTTPSRPSASAEVMALANAIQNSLVLSRLPAPEPPVFKGDSLQFVSWKLSFQTLIDGKDLSSPEKMFFLQRYLGGSALKAVEGFFYSMTDDSYKGAWALLEERFGHTFKIQEAFRDKLNSWSKIGGFNSQALQEYADFLKACKEAMTHIPGLKVLDDCKENQKLSSKLPDWAASRWNRQVSRSLEEKRQYPLFEDFVSFVSKEAMIACNPISSVTALKALSANDDKKDTRSRKKDRSTTLVTSADSTDTKVGRQISKDRFCKFCKQSTHFLARCSELQKKSISDRLKFVKENRLCFGCLWQGHSSKDCQRRHTCDTCKGKHPTMLHQDRPKKKPEPSSNEGQEEVKTEEYSAVSCKVQNECSRTSMIVPVWLSSSSRPSKEVLTYAILDNQSDATFITEETASKITVEKTTVRLSVKTVTSPQAVSAPSQLIKDLVVRGMHSEKKITIPKTYTREFIPCENSQISTGDMAETWGHLRHLADEIPSLQSCEVGLLIGTNCQAAGLPRQIIAGEDDEPYAVRTDLGWSIVNGGNIGSLQICHRIKTKELPEVTPQEILNVLQTDFEDTKGGEKMVSQEDIKFLEILEAGISQAEDGHLMMPLPFKEVPKLPDNKTTAVVRLRHLKKKLQRDSQYYDRYKTFMNNIIDKGDVEIADGLGEHGNVWYIPHHGVYHAKKPNKVRVVFDCSAKHQGETLNDHLLTGPDLLNSLTGVLHRFRQYPVTIMGDIERMFHQFLVNEEHRNFLRFLWWENGDLDTQPKEYRMKVHLFGAASSPGCANFGLKYLAKQHESEFPRAAQFIQRNFYVDDGLQSCKTDEEAVSLVKETQELCQQGGLRLHKFISNSQIVLDSIKASECADSVTDISLYQGKLSTVLGVQWCVGTDAFTYKFQPKSQPSTRRGILSTVSSIYDPLGFIAPVVLVGKKILQEMCRSGIGWDDPLPESLHSHWESWKDDCTKLSQVSIPRCLQPKDFKVLRREIHHFADASSQGYGQCSYLRLVGSDEVYCTLLSAKSRVAPLKGTTIPRLELTAALVSALMSYTLKEELEIGIDEEYFWTDSKVVLSYISNEAKRFHVFVSNRVHKIRQHSDPGQWHHISTEKNPADHASRGTSVSTLIQSNWFSGPDFLWNKSWKAPEEDISWDISIGDPEVKKTVSLATSSAKTAPSILERLKVFSDWSKAVAAIARLQRVARKVKDRSGLASYEERTHAVNYIVKLVQSQAFPEEIKALQKDKCVKSTSPLSGFNPYIDDKTILRVGGRLKHADMSSKVKNPVLLPKESHVSKLLVLHNHGKVQHQGRGITQNELRQNGYWILGGSRLVQSIIHKCAVCRKHRRPVEEQAMADLPEDRLTPAPPFTFSGMDCFGPFIIKKARKEYKRYGLLITCLCCRGVHIELLEDLTTDCFINALRCFIAIRGTVRQLRCDQGTNFVGANNEFKQAMKEMDMKRIEVFLAKRQCEFLFNVPSASHTGGVWERQIRSIRSVLRVVLSNSAGRLDDASLRTFFYEAAAIVNSRPLSVLNLNDPTTEEPLTPNHILLMKSEQALPPPGSFSKEDVYLTKRWRRVQYLSDVFWARWRKEYLLNLTERKKWCKPRRNVMVGDVVLIKDDTTNRMDWHLAIVTDTTQDEDGLVRRVKVTVGSKKLDKHGKRQGELTTLERPIQKLVVITEK